MRPSIPASVVKRKTRKAVNYALLNKKGIPTTEFKKVRTRTKKKRVTRSVNASPVTIDNDKALALEELRKNFKQLIDAKHDNEDTDTQSSPVNSDCESVNTANATECVDPFKLPDSQPVVIVEHDSIANIEQKKRI